MQSSQLFAWFRPFSLPLANRILMGLLILDALFINIHCYAVIADYDRVYYPSLYVDSDHGLGEYFQYLKFLFLILASLFLIFKRRYGYLAWCLLFTAMLLDDSSQYHETIGEQIAVQLNFKPWFGLRAVDWGELCYAAAFGLIMLSIFFFFYRKGSRRFVDRGKDLGLLLLLFVCFAVGVDMLHSLTLANPPLSKVLALLEDGGEMIAISLMVWYFSYIVAKGNYQRMYLFKLFDSKK